MNSCRSIEFVRVHAAVDHVHHRHRQRRRVLAAEVAEERGPASAAAAFALASETPRIAFAPRRPLFGVPSSSISRRSSASWSVASSPATAAAISPLTFATACRHALAAVRVAAVAQLDRLVDAGGGAGRDGRPAGRARPSDDLHLDGRVAAGVEDLAGVDAGDAAHSTLSLARSK